MDDVFGRFATGKAEGISLRVHQAQAKISGQRTENGHNSEKRKHRRSNRVRESLRFSDRASGGFPAVCFFHIIRNKISGKIRE